LSDVGATVEVDVDEQAAASAQAATIATEQRRRRSIRSMSQADLMHASRQPRAKNG
jgi:hypothetical protein